MYKSGIKMEESETVEGLLPLPSPVVAIAINGNSNSKYIVQWALDKFVPEGNVFKLLYVRPRITAVPTPTVGNFIPISEVRDDVVATYIKEVEWQTDEKLIPYKKMCAQRKVQVEVLQIEADDVVNAIVGEVARCKIKRLVIGASSRGIFSRARRLSSRISEGTPSYCTVYAISKGKLSSVRPSDSETSGNMKDDTSDTSCSTSSSSRYSFSSQAEWTEADSVSPYSHFRSPSLPMQRLQALSTVNQTFYHTKANSVNFDHSRNVSFDTERTSKFASSRPSYEDLDYAELSSSRHLVTDSNQLTSEQASTSSAPPIKYSSESEVNVSFELEKLKIELRHIQGMYALAQSETMDASRKLNDLNKQRLEEAVKLREIKDKEEEARELAKQETEKYRAAKTEANYVNECAEREILERKEAEGRAFRETREKEKLEKALDGSVQQYQTFTWEEIVSATLSFSEDLRIGMGSYGTVYKGSLHHTTAAIKVLHSEEVHRTKEFLQEVEILSKIRHPHLLILLGACIDHGCLVYEYMENGSLEERLFRKNNTPAIPWFERYRIAWEVASALVFLHHAKPKQVIHRDLKPANILLDHNLVSKIGDVGLSTMRPLDSTTISTTYRNTGPVGTLSYIDPEYQRTGLVSPKSDVYAFGMVLLQLLTAKPAIALTHLVEKAIDDDKLTEMLDPEAGNWPIEETKELALLGLSCAELRRRDRPDLKDHVLPALERLRDIADKARDLVSNGQTPPSHFICPILREVMDDPHVAADGYTYDLKAIKKWFEENDKSPMTNIPMPSKSLIPNHTLSSAIMEWKEGKQ
ncbi:U-box domain-containing protein 35 isoform X1 [Daucus carota subsp. sativus]|uniref:U-box domain-containing protein 35 isoform X1 n=1 Tax=Daucus carota subsp. sativus TaxID=79200 RepID=UPI0007F04752|nr:PREDICTED: U-box domain-containing protein 35-like isoform X1 [Daucus carota subsp. sativus]XP_017258656.1 PREDICTED: U-box domain-containing protein 35-like isoform X1 [Daucus carota subsp. sativus]XP_017258657.1 PREDICTED: U-box domain-containing protein 35-like isoform X1 [Daucus carota subsp. sativus]XP_017258658.1 PREDICTED: U-box domain-containing protein 35-like isoform X1 [Daucus carota subsp. sativus]XP_017258659.1 PREDICTED: U-box domain-containing protein 35-like isoform X1 [Daucu